MFKTIKVVRLDAGGAPHMVEVEDTLKGYKEIVGGYIETVPVGAGIILICNEEGKLRGLPVNVFLPWGDPVCGNIFFVRDKGEDFGSMRPADVDALETILGQKVARL